MRYSLWMLILFLTLLSIYTAIVFSIPLLLGFLALGLITYVLPAVYLSGILYSRRKWKAFWIGTSACGLIPAVVASAYMLFAVGEFEWIDLFERGDSDERFVLYLFSASHLLPLLGGVAAIGMRRLYKQNRSIMPPSCVAD